MRNLSTIILLLSFFIPNDAGKPCEPIPDTPTARLMYHYEDSVFVLPIAPLNDGTVAKLKCNFNTVTKGKTSATCVDGQWDSLPLGTCLKN